MKNRRSNGLQLSTPSAWCAAVRQTAASSNFTHQLQVYVKSAYYAPTPAHVAACRSSASHGPVILRRCATPDLLAPLNFLLGTWTAGTAATGTAAAQVIGIYTFSRDLAGHAIQRTGTVATCKGPQDFDCNHHDQLTIFPDANALAAHHSSLLALYLDNEGHVIYYTISLPDPHTAVFNSQGPPSAPKFRLIYHLDGDGPKAVMTGKFQFAPPGSDDYHSYLEWFGTKQ